MWSPRCQSDRMLYAQKCEKKLEEIPSLTFRQDNVVDLLNDTESNRNCYTNRTDVSCEGGNFNQRYLFKWVNTYW